MQPALTMGFILCVISVVSFVTVVGVALIALGSSGAFSSKDRHVRTTTTTSTINSNVTTYTTTDTSTTTMLTPVKRSFNTLSLYPSGSSIANLSSYQNYTGVLFLKTPDASILSELADVDATSTVFETERTQYLYFALSNSNATSRALSYPGTGQSIGRSFSAYNNSINLTDVVIHFGPSTNNESFVLIPLPNSVTTINASQPSTDEISAFTTTNGTIVIRLKITVPNDACPSTDGCYPLAYQAYAVVNSNTITTSNEFGVFLACGNVCFLSTNSCSASCRNCDSSQGTSNATVATRRYTMNSTAGVFQFNYSISNSQEQIKVYNGGSLLFNTNCTNTNGSISLPYNSTSSLIRVDVEPDSSCQSSTGNETVWSFIVGCSNSTSRSLIRNSRFTLV